MTSSTSHGRAPRGAIASTRRAGARRSTRASSRRTYPKAVSRDSSHGDEHLIFGEPFVLFNFGYTPTAIPLPGGDANAGLSFHVYPLLQTYVPKVIENAIAWSSDTGGALLNTEWGATTASATLTEDAAAFNSALVPWIFWSFFSEVVPSLEDAPGGKNLVRSTATALIQPYPLAVAGVPQELVVDPARHTMSFTWTTSRADGGDFAKGAVTSFEVPAFTYPDGYTATATNGWITSAPCAPILTVAAKPEAISVTVKVQPKGECAQ